jgi:hypothetical protein
MEHTIVKITDLDRKCLKCHKDFILKEEFYHCKHEDKSTDPATITYEDYHKKCIE